MPDKAVLDARKAARDAVEGARAALRTLHDGLPDVGSAVDSSVAGARSTLAFCLNALESEAADLARVASESAQVQTVPTVPAAPSAPSAPIAPVTPGGVGG